MNRKKLKRSLVLINLAMFIGSVAFIPRNHLGYSWESEFEQWYKSYLVNVTYKEIIVVCTLSLLVTSAIYFFIDAIYDETD